MTLKIEHNVVIAPYTTLKTGGVVRTLVTLSSVDEVPELCSYLAKVGGPYLVLGGGSNVLMADEGFDGVVIHNQIKGREYTKTSATSWDCTFGAGEVLDVVIAETVERELYGLENLSHIPGTVGATPVQNVGAYGVEVSQLIVQVEAVDLETGAVCVFKNHECDFEYRHSFFKTTVGKKYFIMRVTYRLSAVPQLQLAYKDLQVVFKDHTPSLMQVREAIIKIRSEKFPDWEKVGTAGSFFKNVVVTNTKGEILRARYPELPLYPYTANSCKISLGYVLDKLCGLRGYRVGSVSLYEKQAMVLVSEGASADEIKNFARDIQEKVFAVIEEKIEPEVQFIFSK